MNVTRGLLLQRFGQATGRVGDGRNSLTVGNRFRSGGVSGHELAATVTHKPFETARASPDRRGDGHERGDLRRPGGPVNTNHKSPTEPGPAAHFSVASPIDPPRTEGQGELPLRTGEPIDPGSMAGTIVFDDFEDVFTMKADGSDLRVVAGQPGAEFDGAWSPDGEVHRVPGLPSRNQRGRRDLRGRSGWIRVPGT